MADWSACSGLEARDLRVRWASARRHRRRLDLGQEWNHAVGVEVGKLEGWKIFFHATSILPNNARHCAPLERGNLDIPHSINMPILWIEKMDSTRDKYYVLKELFLQG